MIQRVCRGRFAASMSELETMVNVETQQSWYKSRSDQCKGDLRVGSSGRRP